VEPAVIGLVSTAAMAMIGILQHIVGAKVIEEKPELEIIKSLIKELSDKEDDPMQVDVTDTDVTVTKGESKVTGVTTLTNIEIGLKIILLVVTIGYTISKWIENEKKKTK